MNMVSFRLIREQIRLAGGKREPPARVIEGRRATPESQVVIVVAALLAGVAALCNVACARPLDDVVQSGAVRIGVYRDNPPFSFRRDGKLVGVDVDIGRAIAERLKLEPTYMEITAGETVDDDLRNAVWKGHYLGGGVVDLMLSVPYDRSFAQRNPNAAFFAPYLGQEFALARSPSAADGTGLEAFRSEKIGVDGNHRHPSQAPGAQPHPGGDRRPRAECELTRTSIFCYNWAPSAGGPGVRDSFGVFFSYSTVDHAAVERRLWEMAQGRLLPCAAPACIPSPSVPMAGTRHRL